MKLKTLKPFIVSVQGTISIKRSVRCCTSAGMPQTVTVTLVSFCHVLESSLSHWPAELRSPCRPWPEESAWLTSAMQEASKPAACLLKLLLEAVGVLLGGETTFENPVDLLHDLLLEIKVGGLLVPRGTWQGSLGVPALDLGLWCSRRLHWLPALTPVAHGGHQR